MIITFFISNAILAYLCAQFDIAGSLYPKQPVDRARIDSYLHWHHEFRAGCAGYFVQAVWKNKDTSEAEKQLHSVLKKFESYWFESKRAFSFLFCFYVSFIRLGKYQFIQSNTFTIADMQAANEIYQVTPFYPALLDSYPNTKSWLDRVKKVPGHDEMLKGWLKLVPLLQSKRASKL